MNEYWLDPEILARTEVKIRNKDYDGAIYDATTYLEARLQETGQTGTINTGLVKEVFENGKIQISEDKDRNVGACNLFDGVFRLIRNDRAHDKDTKTKIEIPCDNEGDCIKYLSFISLLLHYLDRNLATKPFIESVGVGQNIELRGQNFTHDLKVLVNNSECKIISFDSSRIIIPLPAEIAGTIQIKKMSLLSNTVKYCITPETHENRYRVLATNIELYSDKKCSTKIEGVFGIKMMAYEGGRESLRISPTRNEYSIGDYVRHNFGSGTCGEAWYKDPLDAGIIKYAWTGSVIFTGEIIGKAGSLKPVKLNIRPERIIAGIHENRLVRAVVTESDGILYIEKDITTTAEWETGDKNIAYIDGKGFLRTKLLGKTGLFCKYADFHDTITVEVITPTFGTKVKYFSSNLRRYQQIKFDSKNNLYISNQSPIIYKVETATGNLCEVINLPHYDDPIYGVSDFPPSIDRLAIDSKDTLYINCNRPNSIYKVNSTLREILKSSKALKGLDIDSRGTIYAANMSKELIRKYPDGKEEVIPIEIMSVDVALLDDERIVVSSAGGGNAIDIYSTDNGSLLRRIISPHIKSVSDLAIYNGTVFVLTFHGGEVFKLDLQGDNHIKIAEGFAVGGGLAADSQGNLYVAVFDSADKSQNTIYKIYL